MMVQNRYQRRRMYTRIALGKNRAMDVVSGESSGGTGQLLFLYPLLFALQILQCWIGALSALLMHLFCISHEKWRTSNEIGIWMGLLFLGNVGVLSRSRQGRK